MIGKVWLVGAGPGDVGLFTIKGQEVLKQADVVVYDRLVGAAILSQIPDHAKMVNVGKRAGDHTMKQEQINELLLLEAKKGKKVVRLKGGDPFLFGRGGEEIELLKEHHVPYEIIPGITSAIAVPAYQGIPVTHRDFTSSVHIITGHRKKGIKEEIDYEALVKTKGTLIFLMGISALPSICEGLIHAGMNKDTPAAVLEKGTTARQRRILSTVSNLPKKALEEKVLTPAIIVVGGVCSLADHFSWFDQLALHDVRVVVTRPKDLQSVMAQKLRNKGAEVIEFPVMKAVPRKNHDLLKEQLEHINQVDWIVLTSPTGVRIFFETLQQYEIDIRILHHVKFAVVGNGTKKALLEKGIYPDLMPDIYDGEHLALSLKEVCLGSERMLIPRAKDGNHKMIHILKEIPGIEIYDIPMYDTEYELPKSLKSLKESFESGDIDYAVFTSGSCVEGFVRALKGIDFSLITAICIGKQTKEKADHYGMKTYTSKKASMDSIVDLLIERKQRT